MEASTARRADSLYDPEAFLIGAILADNRAYYAVCGLLNPGDFEHGDYRRIYAATQRVLATGKSADPFTLGEALDGEVPITRIVEIANTVAAGSNARLYAEAIKAKAKRKALMLTCRNALAQVEDGADTDAIVTGAMAGLQNLSHSGAQEITFAETLDQAHSDAEAAAARRDSGDLVGVSTTIPTLDRLTGGFHGPRMIVLGGRPGTYKSAYALQVLLKAAQKGRPVGICSLEMPATEIGSRSIARVCKINGHGFTVGTRHEIEAAKQSEPAGMRDWPLYVDDRSSSLGEILARIVEWKYRHEIQLAVVDHIQLIHHDKASNRFQELAEASRQFKLLAMRLGIPIMVLSQLSREVEREKRRPNLSDLRECGNIEQDADMVVFMHMIAGQGQEQDAYEMILAKQRGGAARQVVDINVVGAHFAVQEAMGIF